MAAWSISTRSIPGISKSSGVSVLNIVLGYYCNFKCGHCVNSSGPHRPKNEFSEQDMQAVREALSTHPHTTLLFTGGEPTLQIPLMNKIIELHPNLDDTKIAITTNGWFATSAERIASVLGQISRLDKVQMSFDIFHNNETKLQKVKNLAAYLKNAGKSFNLTMCISQPSELTAAKKAIDETGLRVTFQLTTAGGRAAETNSYFQFPLFQKDVLEKKCPNIGALNYVPRQGFSACGANLVFGKRPIPGSVHRTPQEHGASSFYKNLATMNMGELAKHYGVDLTQVTSKESHVCNMCEYIHSRAVV